MKTIVGSGRMRSPLILASGSPRRRELLAGLGLTFEAAPADVDETPLPGERPGDLTVRLSELKARRVAERYPDALVLAADTVVALDNDLLGKPRDAAEARAFLERLAGRSHLVYTGHTAMHGGKWRSRLVETQVRFRQLSEREVDWYLSTGEGFDKAGGYAIQGFGRALVAEVCGCYFNVVGLSVAAVFELAKELGVPLV